MIISYNSHERFFYQSDKFQEGVVVTGCFIHPDSDEFSPVESFVELGNGIYYLDIFFKKPKGFQKINKYGIVIKENGAVKRFDTIYMEN